MEKGNLMKRLSSMKIKLVMDCNLKLKTAREIKWNVIALKYFSKSYLRSFVILNCRNEIHFAAPLRISIFVISVRIFNDIKFAFIA